MGVSGSGKSTTGAELSKALGWPFRDADSFHPPANIDKMSRGVALTDDDRCPGSRPLPTGSTTQLGGRACGIVACSALKRAYRRRHHRRARGVRLVYLKGGMALIGRACE